jgi:hypothetical protein
MERSVKLICEVTKAGNTIFKRIFAERPRAEAGKPRAHRTAPTSEAVREMNDKASERQLQIKLNHNFADGDFHLVLTYAGEPPDPARAMKDLQKFQRDANRLYRSKAIVLKYITVTEYKHERIHHHVVMTGGVDLAACILPLWPHGIIRPTWLNTDGDYRRLASYLIKETTKHFRAEDAMGKRRYRCSRTIETPETRRDYVKETEIDDPVPPAGWYIDKDSCYEGMNPVTGRRYMEYVLLPLYPDAKYGKWKRLKQIRPQPLGQQRWLSDNYEYQTEIAIDVNQEEF